MEFQSDDSGMLFFAAIPDADVAAKIHRLAGVLKCAHEFSGRLILPERLHVSLFSVGRWSRQAARRAREAVAGIRMTPFEVSFDRTASFRGENYPFVLVGDEARDRWTSLRNGIAAALAEKAMARRAIKDFVPHVTMLYGEHAVDEYPVEPIRWTVNEFVLIHSLHGHAHLARWRFDV